EARTALDGLRAELAGLTAEAAALERLTRTVEGGEDAILESCTVAPGFETAFAVALGDDLSAPMSDEAPIRWTLPAPEGDAPLTLGEPHLSFGEPLVAQVEAPAALKRRLAQIAIVEPDQGAALQSRLLPGQRLVSLDGALWRWDGFCRSAGAPSAAAERLSQKNRLAALTADIDALTARKDEATRNAEAARQLLTDAATAENGARREATAARATLAAARKTAASAEAAARDTIERQTRNRAALEAALARQSDAEAAHAELEAARPTDGAAEIKARDTARNEAAEARRIAAEAGNRMEAERRSVLGRMRRLERIDAELRDWRGRLESASAHRTDLTERLSETRTARDELAEAPSETAVERRRLEAALKKAADEALTTREARMEGERAEREANAAARKALDTLSQARETAGRTEERKTAADTRLQTVEHDLVEALDVAPHEAAGLAGLDPDAPVPELSACETRLERLKSERERLGGVNLCAEDELTDIMDRQGAMIAERDDLLAAIETLRQGIRELNKEARSRLLASFDKVNGEFQRLFTHLFGGGEASLQLTEAEDPLDAGLDIIARPPGKKPQVLSLLSGGEQTLTATALIFAVFLTNPAPICVLDEIDAPLDDANVERFCALLDEMTRATDTRFMIITHNPITMARMHRLYGVTMVERGVSQLVSVSLEDAEALRETA
ncbi:MAG: chromosome segregation protein SMC, partial [Pseudomonadota bacterium]